MVIHCAIATQLPVACPLLVPAGGVANDHELYGPQLTDRRSLDEARRDELPLQLQTREARRAALKAAREKLERERAAGNSRGRSRARGRSG